MGTESQQSDRRGPAAEVTPPRPAPRAAAACVSRRGRRNLETDGSGSAAPAPAEREDSDCQCVLEAEEGRQLASRARAAVPFVLPEPQQPESTSRPRRGAQPPAPARQREVAGRGGDRFSTCRAPAAMLRALAPP